jgi:hypothetical protein
VNGLLDALEKIAEETKNADLAAYIANARAGLADLAVENDNLAKSINQGFLSSIGGFLSDLASGTKSAKQAFIDLGASALKVLTDVLIKIILVKLALAAFGGGGGGGVGGFLSGLLGGEKAAGTSGGGGFAGGGLPGVGLFRGAGTRTSDSNNVNISDGEYIVNAYATAKHFADLEAINNDINPRRNFAAGGNVSPAMAGSQGAAPGFKIVNVLPNDLLEDYVTSGDGRQALLNFIEYNAGAVNSRLKQA